MKLYTPIMVLITARLVVFHDHQLHSPRRIVFHRIILMLEISRDTLVEAKRGTD
jgi:hypothetical protein